MSTTNDNMPEWDFYLTTDQAKAINHAAQSMLNFWQQAKQPSNTQIKKQRTLASALERFTPQISDVLYSEQS